MRFFFAFSRNFRNFTKFLKEKSKQRSTFPRSFTECHRCQIIPTNWSWMPRPCLLKNGLRFNELPFTTGFGESACTRTPHRGHLPRGNTSNLKGHRPRILFSLLQNTAGCQGGMEILESIWGVDPSPAHLCGVAPPTGISVVSRRPIFGPPFLSAPW